MTIESGVLPPGIVVFSSFPILSALAYTSGLGYRPTCDHLNVSLSDQRSLRIPELQWIMKAISFWCRAKVTKLCRLSGSPSCKSIIEVFLKFKEPPALMQLSGSSGTLLLLRLSEVKLISLQSDAAGTCVSGVLVILKDVRCSMKWCADSIKSNCWDDWKSLTTVDVRLCVGRR